MTPEQQMIFEAVLFALCIGLAVYSTLILCGARKIAKEAYAQRYRAEEELANVNYLYQGAKKEWEKRTNEVAKLYNRLCLPADEYIIVSTEIFVDVCAFHKLPGEVREVIVHIKRFEFGDDRDFALLEAQELLEHLNEK